MITNHVSRLGMYAVLGENFEKAARFVEGIDFDTIEVGQYEIDADRVYASVVSRDLEQMPTHWELHEKYADIHLILSGSETIGCFPISRLKSIPKYDESTDSALMDGLSGTLVDLQAEEFLIAMPEDVHLPNCPGKLGIHSKKMIIKVRI